MIGVDLRNVYQFVSEESVATYEQGLAQANGQLIRGTGAGGEFTGWVHLPNNMGTGEFERIGQAAAKIRSDSRVLVVVGIGGSYLGARAVIEFLKSPNYNLLAADTPEIYFVGNNLSARHLNEIIQIIGDRDFSINVISKSGTTTEPAIAFRIFKKLAEEKYGRDGARSRIYATTDKERGALKNLADSEGYECFVIPDDIGGRYSVLTPVGLLPIACAGIDIAAIREGAVWAYEELLRPGMTNPAWKYAAARNALYAHGKKVEVLACFEPSFRFMTEWWKQLYGESEGKGGRGIFPASVEFTADLHSMGQYIQDGERMLMETVVDIVEPPAKLAVGTDPDNLDALNFLSGVSLHEINKQAARGTMLAHVDGGVPNIRIEMGRLDERHAGALIYFFELACGLSGYLLGVNPFDQPGVEDYKKNMFALLGKPGYETLRAELESRLGG